MKFTVLDKNGVIFFVPERPMSAYQGLVSGASVGSLREKHDRF